MARPADKDGFRCYNCGSTKTRKEGKQAGRQRYLCTACGKNLMEDPAFIRAENWGKRSGARCYHCGSDETVKAGMGKGKKRFKCRDCGKFFIENPIIPSGITTRNRRKHNLPTARQLILELQSLARSVLNKTPTTNDITELSKQGQCHSVATYYAVFGSYVDAVRRARLKQHYLQLFDETDRARMLQELRDLSKRLRRPLVGIDVRRAAHPEGTKGKRLPSGDYKGRVVSPINHYQAAFGSIPKAIAAAGVEPKVVYSREEMIGILRKLDAKLDRPVLESDIDELYRAGKGPAGHTVEKRFGGLAKARKAAGIKNHYRKAGVRTTNWQKYTREELIVQLKALSKKLGKKPTDRDINRAGKLGENASAPTFSRMFGSLTDAYRAAGFENVKPRSYTDQQIIDALKKLTKELGRFPGFHDIVAASIAGKCPSPGTVVRRIGKLTELRSLAGNEIPRTARRYTKEQLLASLRRLQKELGRFPEYREIQAASKEGKCPGPSTFVSHLGPLSAIKSQFQKGS